jgi:hypothetical protein
LQEVAREVAKYELDLVEQDVSCDKCGTEPADDYTIFYGHENDNHVLWTRNHINSYNAAVFQRLDVLYSTDGSSVRAAGLQLLETFEKMKYLNKRFPY